MNSTYIKTLKYFAIMVFATFFTFFFHEMAHWVAYELLGYDAGFTLNGASVKDDQIELPKVHRMITSAAGPVFTLIQGFAAYYLIQKYKLLELYPFIFLAFVMRLGAGWANQFQPNDEGRISLDLGLPLYTISAIVVEILLYWLYRSSKALNISWKINVLYFVLSGLLIFGLVYLDAKFKIRIV